MKVLCPKCKAEVLLGSEGGYSEIGIGRNRVSVVGENYTLIGFCNECGTCVTVEVKDGQIIKEDQHEEPKNIRTEGAGEPTTTSAPVIEPVATSATEPAKDGGKVGDTTTGGEGSSTDNGDKGAGAGTGETPAGGEPKPAEPVATAPIEPAKPTVPPAKEGEGGGTGAGDNNRSGSGDGTGKDSRRFTKV